MTKESKNIIYDAETIKKVKKKSMCFVDDFHFQPEMLKNKVVAILYNTKYPVRAVSFELAAKYLGATVIKLPLLDSSIAKGETLLDTVLNLEAMGTDIFVIDASYRELFPIGWRLEEIGSEAKIIKSDSVDTENLNVTGIPYVAKTVALKMAILSVACQR